jgi:hypothetical protein
MACNNIPKIGKSGFLPKNAVKIKRPTLRSVGRFDFTHFRIFYKTLLEDIL